MIVAASNKLIFLGVRSIATECTKLQRSVKDIPGPKPSLPIVGTSWVYSAIGPFTKDQMLTTARDELLAKYGPIYKERFGGATVINIHDPKDIKEMLSNQGDRPIRVVNEANVYWRRKRPDLYRTVGLVDSNGKEWFDLRSKVSPSMLRLDSVTPFVEGLSDIADRFIERVREESDNQTHELPDIRQYIFRFAIEVIWDVTIGLRLGALEPQPPKDAKILVGLIMDLFLSFAKLSLSRNTWKYYPTPSFKKFCYSEEQIFKLVSRYTKDIISGKSTVERPSILKRFLATEDFDVRDINTVIVDFIAGGIPATSYFLSLLLHRLGKEKEVQRRLQEELDNTLSDRSKPITEKTIKSLHFLQAVMREGFRLTPIIPGILRLLPNNIVCRGYEIPANTPVLCQSRTTSVSERYFTRSKEFIPDRWLATTEETDSEMAALQKQARKNRIAVLQFGIGSRACVGRKFAELDMSVFLAKVFLNFTIESEGEIELANHFIIGPKDKVPVKFIPRHN